MNTTKPRPEEPPTPGIARDLGQLKAHGTATVAELREFLAKMRGRGPQEVLGLVAGSQLLRSVAWATLGALVILVVGTLVPWWTAGPPSGPRSTPRASATPRAPAAAEAKKGETVSTERLAPPAPALPATAEKKPSQADAEKAVKVMGLGETKVADPKSNPLEKSLDNLLDKIK
jgi:cytoskeletal protein RodZ